MDKITLILAKLKGDLPLKSSKYGDGGDYGNEDGDVYGDGARDYEHDE